MNPSSYADLKGKSPCLILYGAVNLLWFRYQVDLASALSNLTAEQFVDQTAHLTILRDGQVVQQINGIVRQFSKGDTGHRHTSIH